jgi:hypothetical protein
MRVHYHRERGARVVSQAVGTCRADLWLAVQGGYLDPDRAGRMDHHLFRTGLSILT